MSFFWWGGAPESPTSGPAEHTSSGATATPAVTGSGVVVLGDEVTSSGATTTPATTGSGSAARAPAGPTRLYLRDTPSYEAPTAGTKSAVLPNAASNDGNSGNPFENRSLLTVRGQTLPDSVITRSSIASTAHVDQYMCRFTSRKLEAQTISAQTWTAAVATLETNANANSVTMLSVYVWRPSNSTVVGYIYDSHTALGTEWSTTLDGQVLTFGGSSVSAQAGDVIVMEFWRHTDGQASGTAYTQQLNYNSYVDVLGTTTADPACYLETPQGLLFQDPYLPVSLSGVFVETMGFAGPVIDGNGNLYVLCEATELSPQPSMYKSADGGRTWAEQDAAGKPGSGYQDFETAFLILSGTKIKFARMRSGTSSTHLSYSEFNTSESGTPDTWGSSSAIMATPPGDPDQEQLTLLERSNGDLIVVYGEYVSGTSSRVVYRKLPSGGAWGSAVEVYVGAIGSTAVVGESDKIHIFCKEDNSSAIGGSANQIVHLSLNSSDTLSSAEVVNDNAISSLENMPSKAVYYDDGGVETVYCAWGRSNGFLVGAFVLDDATPSAEETITDQIVWSNPPDTTPGAPVAHLCVDAATKTIYCVYSNNPSNNQSAQAPASEADLYLATRTHGVGWGTDVELRDGVRIQDISAAVFTHSVANGGAKVLGIFYDDANGPFYDEVALATASSGAATVPAATGSGAGAVARNSTGATTVPVLVGAGTSVVTKVATGATVVPSVTGAGLAEREATATGATVAPVAAGSGEATAGSARTSSGATTIPVVAGSGTAVVARNATGAALAPVTTGAGASAVARTTTGAGTAPAVVASGVAEREVTATGTAAAPSVTGNGTASLSGQAVSSGAGIVPAAAGAGIAERQIVASGDTTVPVATGSGLAERVVTAAGGGIVVPATGSGLAEAGNAVVSSGATVAPVAAGAGTAQREVVSAGVASTPVALGSGDTLRGIDVTGAGFSPVTMGAGLADVEPLIAPRRPSARVKSPASLSLGRRPAALSTARRT